MGRGRLFLFNSESALDKKNRSVLIDTIIISAKIGEGAPFSCEDLENWGFLFA